MCVSTTRLLWFVVLIAPAIAHADLYARYLPHPPPAEGRVYDNLDIYVSSGRVLMTGWNISGTTYSIWFDGQDGSFRVYDQEKQGYYLFSPRTFEADRVRQAGFRTEMESRLKGVPEQQRDAMRRFLQGNR